MHLHPGDTSWSGHIGAAVEGSYYSQTTILSHDSAEAG